MKKFYVEFKNSENLFQSLKNKTKQIDFTDEKNLAKVLKFFFELSLCYFHFQNVITLTKNFSLIQKGRLVPRF